MSATGSSRARDRSLVVRRVLALVFAAALLAGLWLLTYTPHWRQLEYETFDLFTALSAPRASTGPIVVVAIDEPSLQQLGLRWPFPRSVHAALIDRVANDGARAIGVDILFAEPSPSEDDAALAAAIGRAGNVVLAMSREPVETARSRTWMTVEPLPALVAAGAVRGDVGVTPDADFVVRRMPDAPDGFAAEVVALARRGAAGAAAAPRGLIRYAGPHGTFDTVHYYQAVTPGLLPRGYFRDKIVLVGLAVRTSPELTRRQADLYNAPFFDTGGRSMPGVEIHANIASTLLGGRPLLVAPDAAEIALTLAVMLVVGWTGRRWNPTHATAVLAIAVLATVALTYALFAGGGYWLPPTLAIAAGGSTYVAQMAAGFFTERRQAEQTRRAFSQYVPTEVVKQLIERPELLKLGGEARELTLLFADLADFTTIAEHLTPEAVVALLTEYFDAMSAVIHAHNGTVDKFIGDGVMAFWGAPLPDTEHALHAVRAAIEMQTTFAVLARRHADRGGPGLAMRIGLHTGNVIVGNVGSATRFAYTAIGDAVNLASRLEGANKAWGTTILLSGATARQLPREFGLRPVDAVHVKGRTAAIDTFTPCADGWLVERTDAALAAFRRQAWDESDAIWRDILARHAGDGIAAAFVARIASARAVGAAGPAREG